ncbi:hypothetical protein [Synechococcus sp. RSCCF101]|uniref:hypothetical protein n=1 Tax=Synechococcus sp. RSCCF101 TaxID=2511069 RepID=UPI001CD9AD34|nr:hypothetical protein [Synechococcus sp. RSCCF101]
MTDRQLPAAPGGSRRFHPLPRGLVQLYGLVAVLMVLIPEWMAGGTLQGFRDCRVGSALPVTAAAWGRIPELRLAAMSLAELRQLARRLRVGGYASMGREALQQRLLRPLTRLSRPPGPLRRLAAMGQARSRQRRSL